jgi:hypothetical protein
MALNDAPIVSSRYPFLPIHFEVNGQGGDAEALFGTGSDGFLALPQGFIVDDDDPSAEGFTDWSLADGSRMALPTYTARVWVGLSDRSMAWQSFSVTRFLLAPHWGVSSGSSSITAGAWTCISDRYDRRRGRKLSAVPPHDRPFPFRDQSAALPSETSEDGG